MKMMFTEGRSIATLLGLAVMGFAAPRLGHAQSCPTGAPTGVPVDPFPWEIFDGRTPCVPPAAAPGDTLYVDGNRGSDSNAGTSDAAPLRTIQTALNRVTAGQTILVHQGLYRERLTLSTPGTQAHPIVLGTYGDGKVIIDPSTPTAGTWTQVSGSVWKAFVAFRPIAVVVNDVPLHQARQSANSGALPHEDDPGVVTGGSGKWFFRDEGGNTGTIFADMQTTIGTGNPNDPAVADLIVPRDDTNEFGIQFWTSTAAPDLYYRIVGVHVRGAGGNGIGGEAGHISVERCSLKFNGKMGIAFNRGTGDHDNSALYNHVYHNFLRNWPIGNNHSVEGAGWGSGIVFWANTGGVIRGNLVHQNSGEGIGLAGQAGIASGGNLVEHNVAFDNFSVNIYIDQEPNNIIRENFVFHHPVDPSDFLTIDADPFRKLARGHACIGLADEGNTSSGGRFAYLDGTRVYNNVIAGCRQGIWEYAENPNAVAQHSLSHTLIANNTIIMPFEPNPIAPDEVYGMFLLDNGGRNVGTVIANNIIYGFNNDWLIYSAASSQPGIAFTHNMYFSTAANPFGIGGSRSSFGQWAAAMHETTTTSSDPKLVDVTRYRGTGSDPWNPRGANLQASSPARNAGAVQSEYSDNFADQPRSTAGWNIGGY